MFHQLGAAIGGHTQQLEDAAAGSPPGGNGTVPALPVSKSYALHLSAVIRYIEFRAGSSMPFIVNKVLKKVRPGPPRKIAKLGTESGPGPTHGFLPGSRSTPPGDGLNVGHPVTL